MSTNRLLTKVLETLENDTDSTGWIAVRDWQYHAGDSRSIVATLNTADTLTIDIALGNPDDGYPVHSTTTTAGPTSYNDTIIGPLGYIRVTKNGTGGPAVVSLII